MLDDEITASREKTIEAHLDGETRKDADRVLATFSGEPTYYLGTIETQIVGKERVRKFLQTAFDELGPCVHSAVNFFHAEDATTVEILSILPDGMSGKEKGNEIRIPNVCIFTFDGDKMLVEKMYGPVEALLPYLDFVD